MKVNKFRMWDKRLKEMAFTGYAVVGEVTAFNGMEHWIQENWEKTKDECPTSMERWNDFIEMQWTGLKDKNGVDIYEDDLCHTNNETYAIELQEVGGAYKAVNINSDEREDDVHFLLNCNHFLEVIGHIYEEKK